MSAHPTHRSADQLVAGLSHIGAAPTDEGSVLLLVRRPATDAREELSEAELSAEAGLVGDSWRQRTLARKPGREPDPKSQLTLMNARAAELVAQEQSRWALAGDQIFVDLDLSYENLPPGTLLQAGSAVIEITDEPHTGCKKFVQRFGMDAMLFVNSPEGRRLNLRGIYARVVTPGRLRVGDRLTKLPRPDDASAPALMTEAATGFWTALGVPASVDWCEPNYVYTPYVAELWNTLTSLLIFIAAALGLALALRERIRPERRFLLSFAGLAVVGLGSAAFHGTLLKLPQATDELPMVWLSLLFVYCLRFRRSPTAPENLAEARLRHRWRLGLLAYAMAFTAAYFTLESYFAFFIATYASIVAYIVLRSWNLAYRQHQDALIRRLYWGSSGAYLGGLFLMWIPERSLPCDAAFQAIQPHAWFHLTSLVGTYTWILFALHDRWTLRQAAPSLSLSAPAPLVRATTPPRDPA